MILSTKQMSATHSLEELPIDINCHKKSLSLVFSTKLFGIHLDQHLSWREHITNLLPSCYATLSVLRKLRNFAPFHVRKRLVESLVLSKLDYCNVIFSSLPDYQLKRFPSTDYVHPKEKHFPPTYLENNWTHVIHGRLRVHTSLNTLYFNNKHITFS